MRALFLILCLLPPLAAADPNEKLTIAAVQKLFDAMSAHDSEAARTVVLGEGRTVAIREDGTPNIGSLEQFAARLSSIKEPILERMWDVKVRIDGPLAQLWADYDFWRDGKFHHCGVDAVSLVKTPEGWKISGITWTSRTTGCAPSPLGPPH